MHLCGHVLLLVSGIGMSAAIKASEHLQISGYLNAAASAVKEESEASEQKLSLNTLELRFDYQLSDDLELSSHIRGGSDEDVLLEQAHLNYRLSDSLRLKAGKFLSVQGFEAYHSPDLYQYSTSATLVYPGMMNGVALSYQKVDWLLYGAVLASAWDSKDTESKDKAFELATQYNFGNGLKWHLGYTGENHPDGRRQALINSWGSYQMNKLLLAAEFNRVSHWLQQDDSGYGWLLMANYSLNEQWSVTVRTSALTVDSATHLKTHDQSKWTLSPSVVLSKQLKLVFEVNAVTDHLTDKKTSTVAVESRVVF